jgi:hypothetical protein
LSSIVKDISLIAPDRQTLSHLVTIGSFLKDQYPCHNRAGKDEQGLPKFKKDGGKAFHHADEPTNIQGA